MSHRRTTLGFCILLLLLDLGMVSAVAAAAKQADSALETAAGPAAALPSTLKSALTPELLQTKIKETEAASELDEATKTKLLDPYRKALSELEAAGALEAKAKAYKQALEEAPAQAQAIRERLAAREGKPGTGVEDLPAKATIGELEQRLAKTQADAAAVEAKLAEIEKELEGSTTRPAEARQAISQAKQALEDLDAQAKLAPLEGASQAVIDAQRWVYEARRQSLRSEILMLDQELLSQSARVDLLQASRDKAADDLKRLGDELRSVETRLNELRRAQAAEAADETREAQRKAEGKHPLVQELAQRNAELSDELTALAENLSRIAGTQKEIEEQTRRIAEDFRNARQRVEAAGLTQALGQVLIDQRNRLPDLQSYRKAASRRAETITKATLRQIRYREERRRLLQPDDYVAELMGDQVRATASEDLTTELRALAERRLELLDQALSAEETHLRVLGELAHASSQLVALTEEYQSFLSERLLWIRSSLPVGMTTFLTLPGAVVWAIDPGNWIEVARTLLYETTRSPLIWGVLLAAFLLEWKGRALRRRIRGTAEPLRRVGTDSIRYTLEGLGLTLLAAAPLPLLLAVAGWQIYASIEATAFTKAIGRAAISLSLGLYYLRAFRVLCMPGGVADRHFRWAGDVLNLLRRNFDWLFLVLVPLGFVAAATYSHPDLAYSGSLGRLSLIALMVGFALFFARILHPRRGALHHLIEAHPEGWLSRLRKLWYPLVVGTPLALALLTVLGYIYTAVVLLGSLIGSMYLVLGLTVLHQLIVRWLLVARRRISLQAALDRRSARAAEAAGQPLEAGTAATRAEKGQELDLASLGEQTSRLIVALLFIGGALALWAIWSQVLPAFGFFEHIELWHHTGVVDGEERMVPVTLADMGLVLIIALIATIAIRNLPALLEILLLSHMPLSSGSRYAIKTLTGYVIAAAAALMAFSTLGLSWGQVQWLVAALGVGIGFGLQEIVANFISGIIILFERPVRVGDVVTIGDTTGTVARIRIRATTIRNWDRQELLVPNKEFITGRLLNWTLSDQLNRISISVGVDYEADVTLALQLLAEAAGEDERVLKDPAALITFEGFGDNSLSLILRCYLDSLDHRLAVISDLHQSINRKLRAAGISIAFPQRDVHLSTEYPLDVRVHRSGPDTAAPPPSQDPAR